MEKLVSFAANWARVTQCSPSSSACFKRTYILFFLFWALFSYLVYAAPISGEVVFLSRENLYGMQCVMERDGRDTSESRGKQCFICSSIALHLYVKAFQYKVLHNVLYTNKKLFKIGLEQTMFVLFVRLNQKLYTIYFTNALTQQVWVLLVPFIKSTGSSFIAECYIWYHTMHLSNAFQPNY